MTRRPTWKKEQARKIAEAIAGDISETFNVPLPSVVCTGAGADWEWRTSDRVQVWTKAGAAELSFDICPTFAHLYFRFADPTRAESVFEISKYDTRFNRFSGKWNHWTVPDHWLQDGKPDPQSSLEHFQFDLRNDFERVAEPSPDQDELTAFMAEQADKRAAFFAAIGV